MKTATQSHDEFVKTLNSLLANIKKKAENQYEYNLKQNIPSKIMTIDDAAQQAINSAVVGAINQMGEWSSDFAIEMAYDICEDANCHNVAMELAKFM